MWVWKDLEGMSPKNKLWMKERLKIDTNTVAYGHCGLFFGRFKVQISHQDLNIGG